MVNSEGLILHKTKHNGGRKHDYDVYKNNHPITPIQVENLFDLGYLGIQNDFPTVKSVLPFRKKKNVTLSDERNSFQPKTFTIEDDSGTYNMQNQKVWNNEREIQKQAKNMTAKKYDNVSDIVSALLNLIMIHTNRMSL